MILIDKTCAIYTDAKRNASPKMLHNLVDKHQAGAKLGVFEFLLCHMLFHKYGSVVNLCQNVLLIKAVMLMHRVLMVQKVMR